MSSRKITIRRQRFEDVRTEQTVSEIITHMVVLSVHGVSNYDEDWMTIVFICCQFQSSFQSDFAHRFVQEILLHKVGFDNLIIRGIS